MNCSVLKFEFKLDRSKFSSKQDMIRIEYIHFLDRNYFILWLFMYTYCSAEPSLGLRCFFMDNFHSSTYQFNFIKHWRFYGW